MAFGLCNAVDRHSMQQLARVSVANIYLFLPRQAFADDEALTRLFHSTLVLSTASRMFMSFILRSSIMFSIHVFVCLPLLLALSTCPYSAVDGSLLPSILVT